MSELNLDAIDFDALNFEGVSADGGTTLEKKAPKFVRNISPLSELNDPQTPSNPENFSASELALVDEFDQSIKTKGVMSEAVKVDPDQFAKTKELSRQSGIPRFAVESDSKSVESKLNLDAIDFTELQQFNKITANHLTNFDNAVIAQDDIDVMKSIEDTFTSVKDYGSDLARGFEKGQLSVEMAEIGLDRLFKTLDSPDGVINGVISDGTQINPDALDTILPISELNLVDPQLKRLDEIRENLKVEGSELGFFAESPVVAAEQLPVIYEIVAEGLLFAAAGGATAALGGLAVGAVTGPGAIATGATAGLLGAKFAGRVGIAKGAFDIEAGSAFLDFSAFKDDKGNVINQKIAGGAAVAVGLINAMLESLALAALGRTVTPVMRAMIKKKVGDQIASESGRQLMTRIASRYAVAVAAETLTEMIQESVKLLGGDVAKFVDNDSFTEQDLSKILSNIFSDEHAEQVAEAGKKAFQASLVLSSPGTVISATVENNQRIRKSEQEQKQIDQLNEDVKNSKSKERDKENFKEFVERVGDEDNTTVFIDSEKVDAYLQEFSPKDIEKDVALSLLIKQAREAMATGTDIQIPLADFATEIADTKHFDELREGMTLDADSTSPFREAETKKENESYIQSLMAKAGERTDIEVSSEKIFNTVRDQLVDTGRVTVKDASVMAEIVPLWAEAKAERDNKTITEVFDESNLTIEGVFTGERKRLDKALTQDDRGYYDPVNSVIRLNETSNESTFMHEFAHFTYEMEIKTDGAMLESMNNWFERNSSDVAKEAGNGVTTDDVTAFLVDKTTGDTAKDVHIKRATHEQLARGFEKYLMEGKAPSVELREVFRSLARWMTNLYKRMIDREGVDSLNVNLDDNARRFFDSLIATEEQIAQAQARMKLEPLFTDATMAGMTEKQFEDHQLKEQESDDKQVETLRDKIVKQLTQRSEEHWKEEKDIIILDEIEKLKVRKIYQVGNRLKSNVSTEHIETEISKLTKGVENAKRSVRKLRSKNESIGKFIALHGGLNRESMKIVGIDSTDNNTRFGKKPLFRIKGGMTLEAVTLLLNSKNIDGGKNSNSDSATHVRNILSNNDRLVDDKLALEVDELNELIRIDQAKINTLDNSIGLVDVKLNRSAVRDIVGVKKTSKSNVKSVVVPVELKDMVSNSKRSVHPNEAAALFDYPSGAEMLNALIVAPPIADVANANAEKIMVERHGDILNDGSIGLEADIAVQDESRAELMLKELKMLSRNTSLPKIDRQTIKENAIINIGKLSFTEIFPNKYRKAEIKAAQLSAKLLAKGDKTGASAAKLQQVVNFYLGVAATNAKKETLKIVKRTARYKKKKVQLAIRKAGNQYWEQIERILSRFEFRKSTSIKKIDDINLWVKNRLEDDGDQLMLSNEVLDGEFITHWKKIPFAKLQGINDSLVNLEHVAVYSNKITVDQERVDFDDFVTEWTGGMDSVNKSGDKFQVNASRADAPAKPVEWSRWAMAQMTKIPWMASWLDGGERVGISHRALVQNFNTAYTNSLTLWKSAAEPVMKAIKARSKETIKRHNKTFFIPEIKGRAGHTGNLKGDEIIAIALNTGNEGNLRKFLLGEQWADPEIESDISFDNRILQSVLQHMEKEDWLFVQLVWKQMNTLYDPLAEVHKRTTGLAPPKVIAVPVKPIGDKYDGMELSGGYYPVKYDPLRSDAARKREEKINAQTDSMLFGGTASIQASVNAGATNERTKFYDPIRLSMDVIASHFQETIHYITHHDAVRQTNKLVRDKRVRDQIVASIGENEYDQLIPWVNDIAKDGRESPAKMFWDSVFQRLRFGTTLGAMGFKVSTGVIQISGAFNTIGEVGSVNYFQALRTVLGSRESMRSAQNFAMSNSKILKHRTKTMDREIKNAMQLLEGKSGKLAWAQEVSMKHIAYTQFYMVDIPSWHSAYIKEMKLSGDEKKAFEYADFVVENVQGSGAIKDMARISRGQAETGKMLTMFMTFFSAFWNQQRDFGRGVKSGDTSVTGVAAKLIFLYTLPVLFDMMMRDELSAPDGNDEDERLQKMLTKVAMYPAASIPLVRDVASSLGGGFGYNISPIASIIKSGVESLPRLIEGAVTDKEITKASVKGVTKLIGAGLGIPGVSQAWATGEHLEEVIVDGEKFTFQELGFGPKRDL